MRDCRLDCLRNFVIGAVVCCGVMFGGVGFGGVAFGGVALGVETQVEGFDVVVTPFVEEYCVGCHGAKKEKGDIRLDVLSRDLSDPAVALTWEDVAASLKRGEMPPEDEEKRPRLKEMTRVVEAIEGEYWRTAAEGGRESRYAIRRLSHTALDNTVADLLGTPLGLSKGMPKDAELGGFSSLAETMTLSAEMLDRLQANAQRIALYALPEGADPRRTLAYDMSNMRYATRVRIVDGRLVAFSNKLEHYNIWPGGFVAPRPGFYDVTVSAFGRDNRDDYAVEIKAAKSAGLKAGEATNALLKRARIKEGTPRLVHVMATRFYDPDPKDKTARRDIPIGPTNGVGRVAGRFYVNEKAGRYTVRCYLNEGENLYVNYAGGNRLTTPPVVRVGGVEVALGEALYVDGISVSGPVLEEWPLASSRALMGAGDLLVDGGLAGRLEAFLTRAFRRPPSEETVARYAGLYESQRAAGHSNVEAMRIVLEAVLCSPRFLCNYERDGDVADAWSLANRMSYFLWNSMPDEELFGLAASGELMESEVIEAQALRMLEDDRAVDFVADFTGQWLSLAKVGVMKPDAQLFPAYDDDLERAMVAQTQSFFGEVLGRGLSIRALIDSDFAMLNARLARHYGIKGVTGDAMRAVALGAESPRGGVLSNASIMTVTSNGTATSPVIRGIWVLERILGTPPSPPPPDVDPIEPDIRGSKTIRQMLAKHREDETCNHCHEKIDPIGFAFEHFDPIGAWRNKYGGRTIKLENGERVRTPILEIDASGNLPSGETFEDFAELQRMLLARTPDFAEALTGKLMGQALGHEVGFMEWYAVEKVVANCAADDYVLRDLVVEICKSEPFVRPGRASE